MEMNLFCSDEICKGDELVFKRICEIIQVVCRKIIPEMKCFLLQVRDLLTLILLTASLGNEEYDRKEKDVFHKGKRSGGNAPAGF